MNYNRWVLWLPVGMGFGICLYFSLNFEPSIKDLLILGSFVGVISLVGLIVSWFRAISWGLIAIFFGLIVIKIKTNYINTPMLDKTISHAIIEGVVEKIDLGIKNTKITVSVTKISQNELHKKKQLYNPPKRVLLTLTKKFANQYPEFTPQLGSFLKLEASLYPFSYPTSSRSFDFRRYNFYQKIGASGFVEKIYENSPQEINNLEQIRLKLTQKIREKLPGQTGAIAAALLTGDRSGISHDLREDFIKSGLAHILAISGLHLSLLAGIVFFLIRFGFVMIPFLANRIPTKKWAALIVIFVTGGYLALAGFPITTQRAFVMTSVVMGAIMMDRNPISIRLLALSGCVILIFFPESLLTASFQLSFAAVLSLLAVYENTWKPFASLSIEKKWYGKIFLYFCAVVMTTLVATLATMPYTIFLFNRFSLQGVSANLLAIPLTAFFIMPALAASTFCLIFGLDTIFFKLLDKSLEILIKIAQTTANWPGSLIYSHTPSVSFIVLFTFGLLWIALWRGRLRLFGTLLMIASVLEFFRSYDNLPNIYLSKDLIALRQGHNLTFIHSDTISSRNSFIKANWIKELGFPHVQEIKQLPFDYKFIDPYPFIKFGAINEKIYKDVEISDFMKSQMLFNFYYFADGFLNKHKTLENTNGTKTCFNDLFCKWQTLSSQNTPLLIDRRHLPHETIIEGYINKPFFGNFIWSSVKNFLPTLFDNNKKTNRDSDFSIEWIFVHEGLHNRPWGKGFKKQI